jgi:hypothetical protein
MGHVAPTAVGLTSSNFLDAAAATNSAVPGGVDRQIVNGTATETAPRNGRIAKIRLVACAPKGSFVLQVVRVRESPERARVMSTGPVINYKGTTRNCTVSNNFDIEEFDVDVPITKGDSLAVIATQVRFVYNPGSGPSIMFDPPLAEGDAFRTTSLDSGFLMLQAELAPPP